MVTSLHGLSWKMAIKRMSVLCLHRSVLGHGLMGVLMHPHYLHSVVFSFTPGSVDLEKAC